MSVRAGIQFRDITDGLGFTLFIGEKHIVPNTFGTSHDTSIYNGDNGAATRNPASGLALNPYSTGGRFGSWHPGICNFVFGDGSVRGIPNPTSTTILRNLADIADGELVNIDF
jgi:prepilin-type processing-associated H-X9-DG protein